MDSRDEFDRLIWRFIRDEGGWHLRDEIAESLALDANGKMKLCHALRRLVREGYAVVRPDRIGRDRYGVTALCAAPEGLTLEPDEVT